VLTQPKFEAVARILGRQLNASGLAKWTSPRGGYFVTLEVPEGLCQGDRAPGGHGRHGTDLGWCDAPVRGRPAGRRNCIAPSYPGLAEVEQALLGLAVCVRVVAYEHRRAQ
jgi:DNA-binding transcriptional MocR family regulator